MGILALPNISIWKSHFLHATATCLPQSSHFPNVRGGSFSLLLSKPYRISFLQATDNSV